jgi:hypothetical protein
VFFRVVKKKTGVVADDKTQAKSILANEWIRAGLWDRLRLL